MLITNLANGPLTQGVPAQALTDKAREGNNPARKPQSSFAGHLTQCTVHVAQTIAHTGAQPDVQ